MDSIHNNTHIDMYYVDAIWNILDNILDNISPDHVTSLNEDTIKKHHTFENSKRICTWMIPWTFKNVIYENRVGMNNFT